MLRARIVLCAAGGATNTDIATEVGVHVDTARKWRKRFWAHGLDGLKDLPRGQRATFEPVQVAGVKALACTPPRDRGLPLARWSCADLACEAVDQGLVETISSTTVRRWLAAEVTNVLAFEELTESRILQRRPTRHVSGVIWVVEVAPKCVNDAP